jgi:WD40 repeat protein
MTPLQDQLGQHKLRTALRETADEIPAEAPPLRLSPQPRIGQTGRHTRWRAWAAPLAAAVLVIAAVAVSLTVAGSLKHQPAAAGQQAGLYGVPAYYLALTTAKPRSDVENQAGSSSFTDTAAELRSTQTGEVLAKITPPKPYVSFTGVTGAADDRTFVLSAQGPPVRRIPDNPAQRFFLLRIDQVSQAGAKIILTALPAGYVPAGHAIHDMALSPDGTQLAADIGDDPPFDQELYVFNLATGTERAWSLRPCAKCVPGSGGMVYGGVNTDALSWTADGQDLAFILDNTVRLLDTRAAGSDILTDSKTVVTWTGGRKPLNEWRGAIITPDGQTVLGIEELEGLKRNGPIREQLATWSAVTGQQTAVLNNINARKRSDFEQILYTSADGSVFVLTYLQPGTNATIVHDGRDTSIPWSRSIAVAAW